MRVHIQFIVDFALLLLEAAYLVILCRYSRLSFNFLNHSGRYKKYIKQRLSAFFNIVITYSKLRVIAVIKAEPK